MPYPSIVYFDLSDTRFAAELHELKARHPNLAVLLGVELQNFTGKTWKIFSENTEWRFRETFFDGATTIGEGTFCNGNVILTLLTNDVVVIPVSFRLPDMDRYLRGK